MPVLSVPAQVSKRCTLTVSRLVEQYSMFIGPTPGAPPVQYHKRPKRQPQLLLNNSGLGDEPLTAYSQIAGSKRAVRGNILQSERF